MRPIFAADEAGDAEWARFEAICHAWIGTPYRHATAVRGRGADCTLLLAAVAVEAGYLRRLEHDHYPADWYVHDRRDTVMEGFRRHFEHNLEMGLAVLELLPGAEWMRGDILALRRPDVAVAHHAGLVWPLEGGGGFFHAYAGPTGGAVEVSRLAAVERLFRVVAAWRLMRLDVGDGGPQ